MLEAEIQLFFLEQCSKKILTRQNGYLISLFITMAHNVTRLLEKTNQYMKCNGSPENLLSHIQFQFQFQFSILLFLHYLQRGNNLI